MKHNFLNKNLICIIPNTKQTSIIHFFNKLRNVTDSNTIILNNKYILQNCKINNIDSYLAYLERLKLNYNTIIILLTEQELQQNKAILFTVDKLNILAKAENKPAFSPYVMQLLQQKKPLKKELILLWDNKDKIKHTKKWLSNNNFINHFHICDTDDDYKRLSRYLSNKAIGVVLGGGLSFGWAHIGMLKALKERNIPIDFICGTSSGAGVAAVYLISDTIDKQIEITNKISQAMKKSLQVFALNAPILSLFDANEITKMLRTIFSNKSIEDLPIPYLAISCNLNKNKEEIHRVGLLWHAVRSSGAMPGVFPPTTKDGDLLVDGSIINNLPADTIKKLFGKTTIVIANDLCLSRVDETHYEFPASLTTRQIIFTNLFGEAKFVLPTFSKIILRAMMVGSTIQQKKNKKIIDILITPDLSMFSFFEFYQPEIKCMIEIGYRAAKTALEKEITV